MKFFLICLLFSALVLPTGCLLLGDGDGDGVRELTGAIGGSTINVKVGAFSDDHWFHDDSFAVEEDEVATESTAGATGAFTPLVLGTVSGSTYSITLPDEVETMGDLLAWVDTNSDGIFDLGTEQGYFPVKTVDGTGYVISIGYILGDYSYSYYNTAESMTYIISIDADESDGFDFTID